MFTEMVSSPRTWVILIVHWSTIPHSCGPCTAWYVFYHTYVRELRPYRPFPKFCAIKAVVFFAFWQSVLIAGAVSDNIIAQPAETLYTPGEISDGLQDLIIAIEMFIAAWFHLYAFSHQDYKQDGAEKLSVCKMIHTIFDIKDVAADLKVHAKVHAKIHQKVIGKIKGDSKPDRSETEMFHELSPESSVTSGVRSESENGMVIVTNGLGVSVTIEAERSPISSSVPEAYPEPSSV